MNPAMTTKLVFLSADGAKIRRIVTTEQGSTGSRANQEDSLNFVMEAQETDRGITCSNKMKIKINYSLIVISYK